MKRHYKIVLVVLALSVGLWSFIPKSKSDPEKDKLLLELLTYVIEKGHYNPAAIDDTFSKGIYKDYITALDPSKRFFLQSDIDEFAKYETQLDDEIKNKELTFFDLTYNRMIKRMDESKEYYKIALQNPIDYSVNEEINTDYEKAPYCKNVDELKDRWRKQVKLSTLALLVEKQKMQEDIQKNKLKSPEEKLKEFRAKLGDKLTKEAEDKFLVNQKKSDTVTIKTYEQIEKETREKTLTSLNDNFAFISKELDREDWFSVYVNVIASRFDPHTSYFAPDEKERFDVSMSGKLEGIGARLQKKNDFTEITELISGGPAWRQKELEAGDIVLKVAQGDKDPVDVVGMRLDDVVKKIK
jgi:carboxyl-terminal processing protease